MDANKNGWVFNATQPDISVKENDDGQFTLIIESENSGVNVNLSSTSLQSLALQCAALVPDTSLQLKQAGAAGPFREPALVLKHLDDSAIQALLREVQSQTLIDFLWYMKDADLLKLILNNCSKRAAEMIMDDLNHQWRGKNPDNIIEAYARQGREAINSVMEAYRALVKSGDVINLLGDADEY